MNELFWPSYPTYGDDGELDPRYVKALEKWHYEQDNSDPDYDAELDAKYYDN